MLVILIVLPVVSLRARCSLNSALVLVSSYLKRDKAVLGDRYKFYALLDLGVKG